MRIPIWHKNGNWNLRIFFSISLGIHLIFLSIFSILFPDFKINKLPELNIEVSLTPLLVEEKRIEPKKTIKKEPSLNFKPPNLNHEERRIARNKIEKELVLKNEEDTEVLPLARSLLSHIPTNHSQPPTPENEKREIENKKEEKIIKDPILQAMAMNRPFESATSHKSETIKHDDRGPSLNANKEEPLYKKEIKPELSPPAQTVSSPPTVPNSQPISTIPPSNQKVLFEEKKVSVLQRGAISLPLGGDDIPKEKGETKAFQGSPLSDIAPSDETQHVTKLPSLSDGEDIFAQPKYVENPKPLYPQEARKKGYEGEVLLKVEVLANGRVGRVEVKKSSGYEILDWSALTAVKQWKFIPANQGDESIPCWVNIPIKFQLQ